VWRYEDDSGSAIETRPFASDPRMAINLSVWDSVEALERFCLADGAQTLLWPPPRVVRADGRALLRDVVVPAEHRPTVQEAVERLRHLRAARAKRPRLRLGKPTGGGSCGNRRGARDGKRIAAVTKLHRSTAKRSTSAPDYTLLQACEAAVGLSQPKAWSLGPCCRKCRSRSTASCTVGRCSAGTHHITK